MSDQKEIRIETVQQLLEVVTPENKERFVLDFAAFLYSAVDLKQKIPNLDIKAMLWTDDGKHDFTGVEIITVEEISYRLKKKEDNERY